MKVDEKRVAQIAKEAREKRQPEKERCYWCHGADATKYAEAPRGNYADGAYGAAKGMPYCDGCRERAERFGAVVRGGIGDTAGRVLPTIGPVDRLGREPAPLRDKTPDLVFTVDGRDPITVQDSTQLNKKAMKALLPKGAPNRKRRPAKSKPAPQKARQKPAAPITAPHPAQPDPTEDAPPASSVPAPPAPSSSGHVVALTAEIAFRLSGAELKELEHVPVARAEIQRRKDKRREKRNA